MAEFGQINTSFSDGIAGDSKNWLNYSGRMLRNLAIFEDGDIATLSPKPIKDSSTTVTDLVKWMVDCNPYENARYAYGDAGNIYRIASNVWALDRTVSGGGGQGLVMLRDGLYYATATTIGRKYTLSSGSGTYNDDLFTDGTQNLDASVTASGNTYTTPVAIAETAANKITWTPAFDPLTKLQLFVTAKGTGNWTVTIHDALNNVIGSATVANASLTNGVMNTFTFSTPLRMLIAAKYHIHVTSSVADGTLQTGTASDLSTAQYNTYFGILIGDSDYHPMIQHTNGVTGIFCVGNDHYIGIYDGITYNPNKITLEPGWRVRTFAKINENVVAYCWKGATIDAFEYGRAYIWDGISNYFNYSREMTDGMPNAGISFKNRMFGIFGSNGNFQLAPDESSPFRLLQNMPKLTIGSRIEVLPGAIGVWQNRALFGYSNTNDTNAAAYNDTNAGAHTEGDTYTPPIGAEQGVYEFGNQSDRAITYTDVSTEVLSFPYQPSTTIANPTAFKIGCIFPVGKDCYVSYKDGSSFYVDRITKGNAPAAFGSWESLIYDKNFDKYKQYIQMPQKEKLGIRVFASFATLPTGCTVTAKYRLDRATAWTFGKTVVAGGSFAVANIGTLGGVKFREIEYGFDVTATVNYPIITSAGIYFEPLTEETDFAQL